MYPVKRTGPRLHALRGTGGLGLGCQSAAIWRGKRENLSG